MVAMIDDSGSVVFCVVATLINGIANLLAALPGDPNFVPARGLIDIFFARDAAVSVAMVGLLGFSVELVALCPPAPIIIQLARPCAGSINFSSVRRTGVGKFTSNRDGRDRNEAGTSFILLANRDFSKWAITAVLSASRLLNRTVIPARP